MEICFLTSCIQTASGSENDKTAYTRGATTLDARSDHGGGRSVSIPVHYTEDNMEALSAIFEKRQPKYSGR